MNYLAHIFLSGNDEELLIGNFIADSVRGSQLQQFPEKIAQGIILHRQIDTYTDNHPVVKRTKERLRPKYRKYAGVVADIFYDHFLAANFEAYATTTLKEYTQNFYTLVQKYRLLLPERVLYFLPYMVEQDWLLNYGNFNGIRRSLTGLSRRTSFISNMETAAEELEINYLLYQSDFYKFFPELITFVDEKLKNNMPPF